MTLKSVLDTTLRDGEQAPGNEMPIDRKVGLFELIDATGVNYIEVGFPASSPATHEFVQEVSRRSSRAAVTVFARATPKDIDTALDAVRSAERFQLQLLVTGSEIHAEHKRGQTWEEARAELVEACRYSLQAGVRDLSVGLEDSLRASPEYLRPMVEAGLDAGATLFVLADTVGGCVPEDVAARVRAALHWVGDAAGVTLHCHNDLGLALANAVAGLQAGAAGVQCTLAGIGERTGNTPLEELAVLTHYRGETLGFRTALDPRRCVEAANAVLDVIGERPWKHKPLLGDLAFSTAAGIHAKGMMNNPVCYEFVDPEVVGRERRILLGGASGRANLRHVGSALGMSISDDVLERMYERFSLDPSPARYNQPEQFTQLYRDSLRETAR
ncbi:LeuA family protein [Luedemannella helvata]|uniref:2-isopropylmalate synthase n=1 Tax=Luedemannella helvata TaxID=349315 RepID=A0ABN2KWK7_9ACTN